MLLPSMSLAVQGLAALQTASMARPCFAAMGLLQRSGLCRDGQPCRQQLDRQMHAAPQLQPIQPHHPATTPSWVLHAMPRYKAVLIDAAGTLLVPSENTAEVYLRYARKYGVELSSNDVLQRFRRWVACSCGPCKTPGPAAGLGGTCCAAASACVQRNAYLQPHAGLLCCFR